MLWSHKRLDFSQNNQVTEGQNVYRYLFHISTLYRPSRVILDRIDLHRSQLERVNREISPKLSQVLLILDDRLLFRSNGRSRIDRESYCLL